MAWRFGRRYRRYRKYRRFYRKYRRGYARKYVNGSSRSSVRMKTTVNATQTLTAGYGEAGTGATIMAARPLDVRNTLSTTNDSQLSAANSALYRTYCSLYEECKIVGTKIALSVVSAIGGSDIPSLQIYTAWDRHLGYGENAPSAQEIKDSSTSSIATALNNSVAKMVRSCYASDLMEKASWFDASLDSSNGYRNEAWVAAGKNPNMFCPSFAFFLNCPSLGATKAVSISLSITYYFAFRNPRFGGSGSSAKMIDLGPRNVSETMDDPDDGDMDDDQGDIQIFAEGTPIAAAPSVASDMDAPAASRGHPESVTSTSASFSREMRAAGIPTAYRAAQLNRVASRFPQGGKNV